MQLPLTCSTAIWLFAKRVRETVLWTLNVRDPLFVEKTIVQMKLCKTVVHIHATMTLIAQVENAMLKTINAVWTLTLLIGLGAVNILHVLIEKEIVTITLIVKEHYSVAITTVQMDHQGWIVVRWKYIEARNDGSFPSAIFLILYISECGGILTGDQGLFASPNYPSNYPTLVDCEWVVRY